MPPLEISLTDAALRLKASYCRAQAMMLRGEILGRRGAHGNWLVEVASVEKLLAERAAVQ
jgi:hypothetical protein